MRRQHWVLLQALVLTGVIVPLVTSSPISATTTGSSSITAKRFCSGCATTYAGDLSRYGYVVMNTDEADQIPTLKAKNPNLKVLVYKNASATRTDAWSLTHDGGLDGVSYTFADTTHPEWFLKETNGNRIEFSDFSKFWMMDFGSSGYQQEWAKNVVADAKAHGWDGVFIDDVNWSQWTHLGGRTIAKYPTNADQQEAMRKFLAYVGPTLQQNGLVAVPNVFVEWPNGQTVWNEWLQYVSGAAAEHFTKGGKSSDRQHTGADWTWDLDFLRSTQRASKIFLGITYAPSTDTRSMSYARASFLLDWDGGPSTLAFDPGTADPWNPYWTTDLGLPRGAKFQVGAAWRRDFEKGAVVVNPTTSTVTTPLGGSYATLDGRTVTSLTLGAATGALLLAPTAPPNAAPAVTIASPVGGTSFRLGDAITFSASATDPEDGSMTAGLVWTSSLDGRIGTGGTFSRSDLSLGTHTITATATDTKGLTGSTSVTITIGSESTTPAVLVGAGDIADCRSSDDSATASLLDGIPGTVFTVGDNAYEDGTAAQFTDCFGPTWGRHVGRTRPTPGNHDYHTPAAAGYFGYFGAAAGDPAKGYYSYDLGGWHVIALNSEISVRAGSAQEQWLRTDLAAHPASCTVAYWHRPRFSSGTLHGSDSSMKPLWDALYAYGADVVLNGHEHNYERFAKQNPSGVADPNGIREFVIGTGGAPEAGYPFGTPLATSEVRKNDVPGVLKLTLRATSYDWQFVPIAGQTFTDSGSSSCVGQAQNQPPSVNAGPDQTVTVGTSATLSGSVVDDGLPTSGYTVAWAKSSGPGTVAFANTGVERTTATFSAAGTYVLRLTATDAGGLSSFDELTVTVLAPELIFADGFESGSLGSWSASVTDGGDLVVTPGAALAGASGMQTVLDDANPIYVVDESPAAEVTYRARFSFDPNSLAMARGDAHFLFRGTTAEGADALRIELRFKSRQYQVRATMQTDGKAFASSPWKAITDAPHVLEVEWWASSAPGASNGALVLWVDGAQAGATNGVDNDTRRVERAQLGAVGGVDSGTRGSEFFDAFESRR